MRVAPPLILCISIIISSNIRANAFEETDFIGGVSDIVSGVEGSSVNMFNAAAKAGSIASNSIDQWNNVASVMSGKMRPNTAVGRIIGRTVGIYASEIAATPFVTIACRGSWQVCLIVNSGAVLGAFVVSAKMEQEGGNIAERHMPSTLNGMPNDDNLTNSDGHHKYAWKAVKMAVSDGSDLRLVPMPSEMTGCTQETRSKIALEILKETQTLSHASNNPNYRCGRIDYKIDSSNAASARIICSYSITNGTDGPDRDYRKQPGAHLGSSSFILEEGIMINSESTYIRATNTIISGKINITTIAYELCN